LAAGQFSDFQKLIHYLKVNNKSTTTGGGFVLTPKKGF